jgi:Flp pilus assembly protein TadG
VAKALHGGKKVKILRGMNRAAAPGKGGVRTPAIGERLCAFFRSGDEGQSLIEFAVVLPLMMVVVTGVLIFGLYEMQMMALTEGVDSAGRVLAVSAGQTLDPCATAATAVQNAAVVLNSKNLSYSIVLNPVAGNLSANNNTYNASTCSSSNYTTGAPSNLVTGGTVTVTATYNACSLNFYGNRLTPSGCSITQSITEVVQ